MFLFAQDAAGPTAGGCASNGAKMELVEIIWLLLVSKSVLEGRLCVAP